MTAIGQFSVAVLMAVRFQLSCVSLRRTANMVSAAKYSYHITYATLCGSVRLSANSPKTDSKSAEGNLVGVRPASRHQTDSFQMCARRAVFKFVPKMCLFWPGRRLHGGRLKGSELLKVGLSLFQRPSDPGCFLSERYANHRSGRVYGVSVRVDCRSFH